MPPLICWSTATAVRAAASFPGYRYARRRRRKRPAGSKSGGPPVLFIAQAAASTFGRMCIARLRDSIAIRCNCRAARRTASHFRSRQAGRPNMYCVTGIPVNHAQVCRFQRYVQADILFHGHAPSWVLGAALHRPRHIDPERDQPRLRPCHRNSGILILGNY
jgi:hypothetical protein